MKNLILTFAALLLAIPAYATDVESCDVVESSSTNVTRFASTNVIFTGKEDKAHRTRVIDLKLIPNLQIEISSSIDQISYRESGGTYHISARVIDFDRGEVTSARSIAKVEVVGEIPVNALGLNYRHTDRQAVAVTCAIQAQ